MIRSTVMIFLVTIFFASIAEFMFSFELKVLSLTFCVFTLLGIITLVVSVSDKVDFIEYLKNDKRKMQ